MVSIALSCIGRMELNGNAVIQLQNTHQFHPEAWDKLCLSLVVTESREIKIPLPQKGERLWCCSLWQGTGGLHSWLAAQEGCALGKVLLCPRRRGGGQPHGVNRCRSQSVSSSDQRSISAVSDKDCSQVLGEH